MQEQILLFQKIKENLPNTNLLASEIADLLSISIDAAYRRIRGESALTYDEATLIIANYKIVTDKMPPLSNSKKIVPFRYNSLYQNSKGFMNYILFLIEELKEVSKAKNSQIIFTGLDVPIFHYFKYKNLAKFKLKYWSKSILNINKKKEGITLDDEKNLDKLLSISHELHDYFQCVSSLEIWTEHTIESFLKQIDYYTQINEINNKEVNIILDEFILMLQNIQQQAKQGKKYSDIKGLISSAVNYDFYYSDIMIGTNLVLVKKDKTKISFISHQSFNSMATYDEIFYDENFSWVQGLIQSSTLLSNSGEKTRNLFFKSQIEKVEATRKKLLN